MTVDWLEISTMDGVAGTTQISLHALSANNTYQDRNIVLDFRSIADDVVRATLVITQTSDNLIIITRNDTEIGVNNTSIGYGSSV